MEASLIFVKVGQNVSFGGKLQFQNNTVTSMRALMVF